MPTIPMIIPLLVGGILFGYILRTKRPTISRRFMALGSLLGGAGNAVNAATLYLFQNQGRTSPAVPSFVRQTMPTQTPASFLLLSFVIGVLIVLLVLVPAVLVQSRKLPHLPFSRGGKNEL